MSQRRTVFPRSTSSLSDPKFRRRVEGGQGNAQLRGSKRGWGPTAL